MSGCAGSQQYQCSQTRVASLTPPGLGIRLLSGLRGTPRRSSCPQSARGPGRTHDLLQSFGFLCPQCLNNISYCMESSGKQDGGARLRLLFLTSDNSPVTLV